MRQFGVAVVIILLIAVGVYMYVSQNQPAPPTNTEQTTEESTTPATPSESTPATTEEESTPKTPDESGDSSEAGGTDETTATTATAEPTTPLTFGALSVWPRDGVVALSGSAVFVISVSNPTQTTLNEDVALQADGNALGRAQTVTLDAGAAQTLTFEVRDLKALGAGRHSVSLGGQSVELTVVALATEDVRTSSVPPDPKVIGADDGLTEVGVPGGKIVIASTTGPKTLNGLVAQETSSTDVTGRLGAGLVEINPINAEVEPALATHWEFSEDHKVVTFYLRRGVQFSDGQPFTADDVVFTFNDLIFNDDVHTDARDGLQVKGEPVQVEKIDDYTVRVTTAEPFRPLMRSIGVNIYPRHKLADKLAKLNPGARGAMRAVKQTLDSNREALVALSAEAVDSLDQALGELNTAIEAQSSEQVTTVAGALKTALETLNAATTDEQETLKTDLEGALAQVDKLNGFAGAGQWEGVPPGTFDNTWTVDTPASEVVGLGPFTFVRYDVDQQVVLKRNPHYWKVDAQGVQLPYVDQMVFLVVENQDVSFLKFKTGETDTYGARPEDWPLLLEGVSEEDCQQAESMTVCQNVTKGWELLRDGPLFGTAFVVFNQDAEDPLLQLVYRELKFREAVAYAIDKPSVIDNIYNGLAIPQWSPTSMPGPYYDRTESFTKYPFDLEKSGQLLDELGLVDTDGDGVRNISDQFLKNEGFDVSSLAQDQQNENDRELEFLFITNSGNTLREKLANLITRDLVKVGLKPTFKPVDFNSLVTDLLGGKFQAVLIGLTGGVEPNNGSNVWKTDGGLHFWRYSSKTDPPAWEQRVNELFDLAATTFDEEKVTAYYREYQQLVSENLPVIYTVNQQYIYASKATLGNNDSFNPLASVLGFVDVLWWKDKERRQQVDEVQPQK